jgi:hypothetical protein
MPFHSPLGEGKGAYVFTIIIIIIGAPALGLALGIFIFLRLKAEPIEDPEDEERRRRVEEYLGLRQPPNDSGALLAVPHDPSPRSLHPHGMYELRRYGFSQNLVPGGPIPWTPSQRWQANGSI